MFFAVAVAVAVLFGFLIEVDEDGVGESEAVVETEVNEVAGSKTEVVFEEVSLLSVDWVSAFAMIWTKFGLWMLKLLE